MQLGGHLAGFTLGVRANVQPKSSIPIRTKVEISPKALHWQSRLKEEKKIQSAPSY
jgi:hypothetical protein